MSNLSQFLGSGGLKPTANYGRALPVVAANAGTVMQAYSVLSGSCTANTLKTILSVSGKGALAWLGASNVDATSRTLRIKITIDGVVVYDATSAAITSASSVALAHGAICPSLSTGGISNIVEGTPLFYNSSLLIEFATSITETDLTRIGYINYLR